jgi:DNA-binding MarR family transcriptional regulator
MSTTIDKAIKSKFKSEQQRMVVNLLYTANWLKNIHADMLNPFDITTQQYNILRILRGSNDWMTMNTVKERMIDKSPNTTRLTDKLVAKKCVERKRCDEDRRVVYVKITAKGIKLMAEIDEKTMKPFDKIADKISSKDAKQVSAILDELRG